MRLLLWIGLALCVGCTTAKIRLSPPPDQYITGIDYSSFMQKKSLVTDVIVNPPLGPVPGSWELHINYNTNSDPIVELTKQLVLLSQSVAAAAATKP